MAAYLIKLRQNIFQTTLVAAGFLGLSLSYLVAKAVPFLLDEPLPSVSTVVGGKQMRVEATLAPDREEILGIATSNLLRGTPVSLEQNGEAFKIEGLTLVGIIAGAPRYARASILIEGQRQANAYAIGETVRGGKLVTIYTTSIDIENAGGSRFTLYLDGENNGSSTLQAKRKRGKAAKGGRVEKINLSRDRFKQLIKNQAELFRLKFSPAIKNGKIKGWRLLKVPKDHFLYAMGARSGDTIRRYNGQELENQERMINMWQSLQSANQVSVDMERGGRIITYDISIQ